MEEAIKSGKKINKEKIITFLKNNIIFFVGIILLVYKAIFLNVNIGLKVKITTVLYTISVVALIMSPTINNRKKFAYLYLNIIYVILTLLIYANFLYYTFSTNFISFYQIENLQYAEEIGSGLTCLINIKNIMLFWVDNILLLALSILAYKKTEKTVYKNKILKSAIIIALIILNICIVKIKINGIYKEKSYNKSLIVQLTSIYFYHYEDAKDYFSHLFIKEEIDTNRLEEAYNKNKNWKADKTEYTGIAKDSNVIILQLESFNEYLIGKTANGKEIIPNLNKFFNENIYCEEMYNQGLGTTADSEFEMENAMYPLENGYVFQKYYNNNWMDIYSTLKEKRYYTSFMHPNVSTFWNRDAVYNLGYGIDEYNDINRFPNIEPAGEFYSDEGFLDEAVTIMNSYEENFCTTLVTVTTHIPFSLDGVSNLTDKLTLKVDDVEQYGDDTFGRYVLCNNFVDYTFGKFLNKLEETGLLEKSILVVYGDHGAGISNVDAIQKLYEENGLEYTEIEDTIKGMHVPFGMKVPGINESKRITKAVAKIDVKPTILDLLGVEDKFSIGETIFSNKDYAFIKGLGYITSQNYCINDKYYDRNTLSEIEETSDLKALLEKMEEDIFLSDTIIKNDLLKEGKK